MAIITGHEIKMKQMTGGIKIAPFNEAQLGPNSYNVRLGRVLLVYYDRTLDMKDDNPTREIVIPPEGIVLRPGRLYLGSTMEWLESRTHVPLIEGRSSLARLGVSVHAAAGVGDIGFTGCLTFEITVTHPVRVYAGAEIAQLVFHTTEGLVMDTYKGKYCGFDKPVASRVYLDMEGK